MTPEMTDAEQKKDVKKSFMRSNSSEDSFGHKRVKDSPDQAKNKTSTMGAFVPKDCAIDIDKDYIYKIGKDIFANVKSTQQT